MNVEQIPDEEQLEEIPDESVELPEKSGDEQVEDSTENPPENSEENPPESRLLSGEEETEAAAQEPVENAETPVVSPSADEGIYPWQGMLCYVPGMFWFPVVFHAQSRFLWYHASQGFRLTLLSVVQIGVIWLVNTLVPGEFLVTMNAGTTFSVEMVSRIGQLIPAGAVLLCGLTVFYLMLCGVINVFSGSVQPLPLIGSLGMKKKKRSSK